MFNFMSNIDGLAFILEARQDFDKTPEEGFSGRQHKHQNEQRGEKGAKENLGTINNFVRNAGASSDGYDFFVGAARQTQSGRLDHRDGAVAILQGSTIGWTGVS